MAADLDAALVTFFCKIAELSQVYERQDAVLPLAIDLHEHIVAIQPTDLTNRQFHTNSRVVLQTPHIHRFGLYEATPINLAFLRISQASQRPERGSSICSGFNKGGCNWQHCKPE